MSILMKKVLFPIVFLDSQDEPVPFSKRILAQGPFLLQLRAKKTPDNEFEQIATEVVKLSQEIEQQTGIANKIIINDRADIAKVSGADGVHLGQDDMSPKDARKILGQDALVGLSTHNLEQVEASNLEPIDYIGFGPIFNSKTKSGHSPTTGLEELSKISKIAKNPVVAIGGINSENFEQALKAGADKVAVVSDLSEAEDLEQKLLLYRRSSE